MNDWRLIKRYVEANSQEAFGDLVRCYTNLVYCTCHRELQDRMLAEEAAQAVFLILARKAPSFRSRTTLSSWLFQTALLTAKNIQRQEQRRQRREQEAAALIAPTGSNLSQDWEEAKPLLNAALNSLSVAEQDLIIRRFWEDHSLLEISSTLGVTEDAARMRVNRALNKLRRYFVARNIVLPVSALAALLPQAIYPSPAHCAEAILRLCLTPLPTSAASTSAHLLAQGVISTMNINRLKLQLGVAVLVAALSVGTVGAVRMNQQAKARTLAVENQQASDPAQAVLSQMYATYAAMHSFKCNVISREDLLSTAQEATYEFERPNKIRFHRVTHLGGDMSGQALAVSDGISLFVTCTEKYGLADRYAKTPLDSSVDNNSWAAIFGGLPAWGTEPYAGMPAIALGLKSEFSSQLSVPEYSLGQPSVMDIPGFARPVTLDIVIARMHYLTPVGTMKEDPEVVTYYIGHADHLLYKLTAAYRVSPSDWDTRTELINGMEINSKLSPADFVFTPPPSSHEVQGISDLFPGGRM
jgi:RNA polymerase sigma factor (sigma-70 family)